MNSTKTTPAMLRALDKISRGMSPAVSTRPGHCNTRAASACIAAGLAVHDNAKGWRLTVAGAELLSA